MEINGGLDQKSRYPRNRAISSNLTKARPPQCALDLPLCMCRTTSWMSSFTSVATATFSTLLQLPVCANCHSSIIDAIIAQVRTFTREVIRFARKSSVFDAFSILRTSIKI